MLWKINVGEKTAPSVLIDLCPVNIQNQTFWLEKLRQDFTAFGACCLPSAVAVVLTGGGCCLLATRTSRDLGAQSFTRVQTPWGWWPCSGIVRGFQARRGGCRTRAGPQQHSCWHRWGAGEQEPRACLTPRWVPPGAGHSSPQSLRARTTPAPAGAFAVGICTSR